MKANLILCLLSISVAGTVSAQPGVGSILNNYSYTLPGSPNYGIAQGSLFTIFGTGIGPAQTPFLPDLSQSSLPISLSSVMVTVTVNGTVVQTFLYYVSDTQIAGVLPSNTPVGTGTIVVSYGGRNSPPAPITVVPAAFGLLTLSGSGSGAAAVFDANNGNAYVTPTVAANPGDALVLWGSGLGASPGDESKYPFPQTDLRNNVRVFIGGQPAQIAYAGRSQFPALDQINVTVPAGVLGCNVAIIVQTGNYVSNAGTFAIAASGRTCSDPTTSGLSTTALQNLMNKGTVQIGAINLVKSTTQTAAGTSTNDSATALFARYPAGQFTTSSGLSFQQTSLGSCVTYQYQGQAGAGPPIAMPTYLDAGAISVTLPGGVSMALPNESGIYSVRGSDSPGSSTPSFIPATGGAFSFSNTGGSDVGQISGAQITMPPALNWTNMSSITTVARSQGLTLTWDTSHSYGGFVTIAGTSFSGASASNAIVTGFTCTASYGAGAFVVQPYVLLAMTPSQSGSLSLGLNAPPVQFDAPSIDYAVLNASSLTGKSVMYQ